jgi:predicted nucleic acid-binding protein
MAELIETYADLRLGTVDASVIATAERVGSTVIATLDRRHFTIVRPRHTDAFELVL